MTQHYRLTWRACASLASFCCSSRRAAGAVEEVDAQFTLHGGLRAIDKVGGKVTTIASTPDVLPLDVLVEPGGAYVTTYSNSAGGELFVASLDGSKKTSLAGTPGVLYVAIRTNDRAVYWTINWSGVRHEGAPSVRKHCK